MRALSTSLAVLVLGAILGSCAPYQSTTVDYAAEVVVAGRDSEGWAPATSMLIATGSSLRARQKRPPKV